MKYYGGRGGDKENQSCCAYSCGSLVDMGISRISIIIIIMVILIIIIIITFIIIIIIGRRRTKVQGGLCLLLLEPGGNIRIILMDIIIS